MAMNVALQRIMEGPAWQDFAALCLLILATTTFVIRSRVTEATRPRRLASQAAQLGILVVAASMMVAPTHQPDMANLLLIFAALLLGSGLWALALLLGRGGMPIMIRAAAGIATGSALLLPALLVAEAQQLPADSLPLRDIGLLLGFGLPLCVLFALRLWPASRRTQEIVAALGLLVTTQIAFMGIFPTQGALGANTPWVLAIATAAGMMALLTLQATRQQRRAALSSSLYEAEKLRDLADASFEGIALLDRGTIVNANARLCAMLDKERTALIGRTGREMFPEAALAWMQKLYAGDLPQPVPAQLATQGGMVDVDVMARRLATQAGERVVVTCRDRSEAVAAATRIRHLSEHDALTGLPNRTHFLAGLTLRIELMRRDALTGSLLVVQLDGLRSLQQVQGGSAERKALQEAANRLQQFGAGATARLRSPLFGRLDGASFALLLDDTKGGGHTPGALRAKLAEPYTIDGTQVILGVAIGVARCPEDADSAEELLALADIAAERAAGEKGEGIALVNADRDRSRRQQRALEQDMRFAAELGQLRLYWQPQIALQSGELIGFEVLVRWQHPLHGLIMPDRFLPAAEACGAIHEIGAWVLHAAVVEAVRWATPLSIAVNVSGLQLQRPGFADLVARELKESGLAPERLELEITETVLIDDRRRVMLELEMLAAMGVKIAMDDFGTGFASIAMLRTFPFSKLKLDKSFLRDLDTDAGARAIVEASLQLGHGLGMVVLAEGVETPLQLAWLRDAGCDHGQGYLFGRPAPIEDWEGRSLAPLLAHKDEQQPGQQQERREGQPAARALAKNPSAPQAHGDHHEQADEQGGRGLDRVEQDGGQEELHVPATQYAEAPGGQQGQGGDQPAQHGIALRQVAEQPGQKSKAKPRKNERVTDTPMAHILRNAKPSPYELGNHQASFDDRHQAGDLQKQAEMASAAARAARKPSAAKAVVARPPSKVNAGGMNGGGHELPAMQAEPAKAEVQALDIHPPAPSLPIAPPAPQGPKPEASQPKALLAKATLPKAAGAKPLPEAKVLTLTPPPKATDAAAAKGKVKAEARAADIAGLMAGPAAPKPAPAATKPARRKAPLSEAATSPARTLSVTGATSMAPPVGKSIVTAKRMRKGGAE